MNDDFWEDFRTAMTKAAEGIQAETKRLTGQIAEMARQLKPIIDLIGQREVGTGKR